MFVTGDSNFVAIGVAVLVFIVAEAAARIGRRRALASAGGSRFGILQSTAFALVSLMLGFSFSSVSARFDGRRDILVRETNAIGSTVLLTDVLDSSTAPVMRGYLRTYVDVRTAYLSAVDPQQRAESGKQSELLQAKMWDLTMAASRRYPRSTTLPLFIAALNESIDASHSQKVALSGSLPEFILFILVIIIIIAVAFLGLGFSAGERPGIFAMALFATMIGLVFAAILDLNQPERSLIRIDLSPLTALKKLPELPQAGPTISLPTP
jgi:hypothetical protein